MDLKENLLHFLSILALLRGPTIWPSWTRFGSHAPNLIALTYSKLRINWLMMESKSCTRHRLFKNSVI